MFNVYVKEKTLTLFWHLIYVIGIKIDSVALHLNETQNKLSWIKLDLGRNLNSLSYERQTLTNFSNNQYGKSWSNGINNNL